MKTPVIIFDAPFALATRVGVMALLAAEIELVLQTLGRQVLKVTSIEEMDRQIGRSRPRLVVVPACKWTMGLLRLLRDRFPRARIVMVYPDQVTQVTGAVFRDCADAIMEAAKISGLWLLSAKKAKTDLSKWLTKTFLSLRRGVVLDGYRLVRKIGEGGFGTVWLASNVKTHQLVALKVIDGAERINVEVGALRKYVHVSDGCEYLLRVMHINGQRSRLWFVTELADSIFSAWQSDPRNYLPKDLGAHLKTKGQLLQNEAGEIVWEFVSGLSVLHHAGLLHGDVKLSNIFQLNGNWALGDPGLVRFIGEPAKALTKGYYPQPLTCLPSDDLYAAGVILWELSTGRDRLELDVFAREALKDSADPVERIVAKATARDVQERYPNAEAMLRDIEALLRSSENGE